MKLSNSERKTVLLASFSYSYQRDFREPHFTEGRCGTARWPLYRQSVALPSFLKF